MTIPVRVSRACINPPGKDDRKHYNAEWAELEVDGNADLSGCELQQLVNPHTKRQTWGKYYRFGANEHFPKGCRIRVHSGHAPAGAETGPDAQNCYHRYVAVSAEHGQWLLNNDGDSVKLLDAAGNKVDESAFSGKEGYCDEGKGPDGPKTKAPTQYA